MGGAFARGLVRAGMPADHITLYDTHPVKAHGVAQDLGPGAQVIDDAARSISGADVILIAVKPQIVPDALAAISEALTPQQLIISIAAGMRISRMEGSLPPSTPVIRAMPNTAATVGEAASALARGTFATSEHVELAMEMFCAVGKAVEVDERLMDAVTGLSGSGPAYVFLLIESLMDGGVKAGLTRDAARLLAAQTVYGAAKMILETSDHPAQLKDNVTTPGGTTMAALAVLERAGVRIAYMDAIEAAAERSRQLS